MSVYSASWIRRLMERQNEARSDRGTYLLSRVFPNLQKYLQVHCLSSYADSGPPAQQTSCFYQIWNFFIPFTNIYYLTLSWKNWIHSFHINLGCILTLSSYLKSWYSDELQVGRSGFDSRQYKIFVLSTASNPGLGSILCPIQCLPGARNSI